MQEDAIDGPTSSDDGDRKPPAKESFNDMIQRKIHQEARKDVADPGAGGGVSEPRGRGAAMAMVHTYSERINSKMQNDSTRQATQRLEAIPSKIPPPPPASSDGGDRKPPAKESFNDMIQRKIDEGARRVVTDPDAGGGVGEPCGRGAAMAMVHTYSERINSKMHNDSTRQATERLETNPSQIRPPLVHRMEATLPEHTGYGEKVAALVTIKEYPSKPQAIDDVEDSPLFDEGVESPMPRAFDDTMAGKAGEGGDRDSIAKQKSEKSRDSIAKQKSEKSRDSVAKSEKSQGSNRRSSHSFLDALVTTARSVGSNLGSDLHIPIAWVVTDDAPAPLTNFAEGEVVEAQRVGFVERKWKSLVSVAAAVFCGTLAVLAVLLSVFLTKETASAREEEVRAPYCDPCIDRTAYNIRAVLSDAEDLLPPARQAARDMRVNLEVRFYKDGGSSDQQMSDDIRSAVRPEAGVDALIVTVPSKAVANAVRYAATHGVPVFGTNSGFDLASGPGGLIEDESMLFFTGMDERSGGERAASYFLEAFAGENDGGNGAASLTGFTDALFLSPPGATNPAYEQRFEGYRDRLMEASNNSIKAEWIEVDPQNELVLREKLSNCSYQSVLVGQGKLASEVVDPILTEQGCLKVKMGTFDTAAEIEELIAKERIEFSIDQFKQLQGWAPVHFAAMYVSTGFLLVPPPAGVYHSGPVLLTKNNVTRDSLRICTGNEPPTGPNAEGQEGTPSGGECIHRKNITIGGVVPDIGSIFWDRIYAGARQGAIDMGVELKFDRFEPQESNEILYQKMAARIQSLCESGVDGLFVTLPDDVVVDAVRNCTSSNPSIQIMSIDKGYVASKEMNLNHHLGVIDKDAGYLAGKRMMKMATFDKAACLDYKPKSPPIQDRCEGFKKAMAEMDIEYLHIQVPDEDDDFISTVEMTVGESGEWGDYGFLLPGPVSKLPAALKLKDLHRNFALANFGVSDVWTDALDAGRVLYGVYYQAYLQGYLPVPILTHAVTEKEYFLDHQLKAGPSFLIALNEKVACNDKMFPVCSDGEIKSGITPSLLPAVQPSTQPSPSMQPPFPSMTQPSSSTSALAFDMRPTLETVQSRGHVRCGLSSRAIESGEGFFLALCRSIAAVLFGNPDKFVGVPVTSSTRFQQLQNRSCDLLLSGDTHTVEREVEERTTGAGFAFTSPYYYDGLAYFGNPTFEKCAEEQARYETCSSLRICAIKGTTGYDHVKYCFPSGFYEAGFSLVEIGEKLLNGTCNVMAADKGVLLSFASDNEYNDGAFVLGKELMSKEPLAVVTRNNDHEFSDIINWVVQALFYGEEQGMTEKPLRCQEYRNLTARVLDLDFLSAVHCMGNCREILRLDTFRDEIQGMNQINNGTTGMLYATPFGDLEQESDPADIGIRGALEKIRKRGSLNCGVVVPDGFTGEISSSTKLVGMTVGYCGALAAALFSGNSKAVKVLMFSENESSSLESLDTGTIDILAGRSVQRKYDFETSPSLGGFHFSTPYYYGNGAAGESVSFFTLATRDGDVLFSSFVNCVVLATLYAQENGIGKKKIREIPSMTIFGSELTWALRDTIAFSGGYDQIYAKNFGNVAKDLRGRNILNSGGPQIHSFPGLHQ